MEFELRTIKKGIFPKASNIFVEDCTFIEIMDEAAGEFLFISQPECPGGIKVSSEEWPMLKASIENMLANCRDNKPTD